MLTSSIQVGLSSEIQKQKMQNDKPKIVNNNSNTTMWPLGHYAREIRRLKIKQDATEGGFPAERKEDDIAVFKNISLQPTTTNEPALDKQRSRKYTKYMYAIINSLTDQSKVHFIRETVCYILYQYLYNQQVNNENFIHRSVKLVFSDWLYTLGEHPSDQATYVVNASNITEVAHAIRAILLANNTYAVTGIADIIIYVPTPYLHEFDYSSNIRNTSRIIETEAQELYQTVTSLINNVVPKTAIEADREGHGGRDAVDPVLDVPEHPHKFVVDVQDHHAAMSCLSRSFGVLYFNGRCYNGNLVLCNAQSQEASQVIMVQSNLKLRIAFVHKFVTYANAHEVMLFSSARYNNKIAWYTRNRFNFISMYVKRFIGSFAPNDLRDDLGGDYRSFLNIVEILGDNYIDVKLTFQDCEQNFNLISCCYCPISIANGLSDLTAYTQSNEYDAFRGFNRAAAWFGGQQHTLDTNAPNIRIADKRIAHEFEQEGDGDQRRNVNHSLFLVEYCNCITNWNDTIFGSYAQPIEVNKYNYQLNSTKKWDFNKYYYLENGSVGYTHEYGMTPHINLQIFCYANNLIFDCNAFIIPYLYEYDVDEETGTISAQFLIKHQRYITPQNADLYHPSGDSVKGTFKSLKRRNFK